jgi:hypothetical protein
MVVVYYIFNDIATLCYFDVIDARLTCGLLTTTTSLKYKELAIHGSS